MKSLALSFMELTCPRFEHVVVARLEKSGQSIATAESCTAACLPGALRLFPDRQMF